MSSSKLANCVVILTTSNNKSSSFFLYLQQRNTLNQDMQKLFEVKMSRFLLVKSKGYFIFVDRNEATPCASQTKHTHI